MSDKDGGQAFPLPQAVDPNTNIIVQFAEPGMTLRDWFAGQALGGLLAADAKYDGRTSNRPALSADAYATADAMLAERSKP